MDEAILTRFGPMREVAAKLDALSQKRQRAEELVFLDEPESFCSIAPRICYAFGSCLRSVN